MTDRLVVDCLGLACPMPVLRLANAVKEHPPGALIEVWSDDPGAKVDIPVWCRMKRHEFVGREDRERGWAFVIRTVATEAS